ncbi:MAG: hypothetical protein HYT81_10925 [Gemmatimonadetes bacterium]|nr:hypothetical protein [Gemmatimonadota bacterium]MBI2402297.1 hypothetical protein [Gemmatimonadota bacterium]
MERAVGTALPQVLDCRVVKRLCLGGEFGDPSAELLEVRQGLIGLGVPEQHFDEQQAGCHVARG